MTNRDTPSLEKWWIKELDLTEEDFYCLQNKLHLSDRVINASQRLMKQQFKVHGLQNTLCGQNLTFEPKSDACIVQMLHTGRLADWNDF